MYIDVMKLFRVGIMVCVKILIATWGKPWMNSEGCSPRDIRWDEVEYVYENHRVRSRSSLSLLLDVFRPVTTFLVVLDTVIDANYSFSKYEELEDCVSTLYREFVKNYIYYPDNMNTRDLRVVVAPGSGIFLRQKLIIESHLRNFFSVAFAKLVLGVVDVLRDHQGELEIILDTTHALNYMPALVYDALEKICSILAYAYDVRFKVVNAEPYEKGISKLRIHIVKEEETVPLISRCPPIKGNFNPFKIHTSIIDDSSSTLGKSLAEEYSRIANDMGFGKWRDLIEHFMCLKGSLVNGFPLALHKFYIDPEEIRSKVIEPLISLFYKHFKIRQLGNKLVIRNPLIFTQLFDEIVECYLIASILRNLGVDKKDEVGLDELKRTNNSIFRRYGAHRVRIGRDLKEIEDTVSDYIKQKPLREWIVFAEIYREVKKDVGEGFDVRNFLAHSGFEKNSIEVVVRDGIPRIRYRSDMTDVIKNAIIETCTTIMN